jgi:hypothetical protein
MKQTYSAHHANTSYSLSCCPRLQSYIRNGRSKQECFPHDEYPASNCNRPCSCGYHIESRTNHEWLPFALPVALGMCESFRSLRRLARYRVCYASGLDIRAERRRHAHTFNQVQQSWASCSCSEQQLQHGYLTFIAIDTTGAWGPPAFRSGWSFNMEVHKWAVLKTGVAL